MNRFLSPRRQRVQDTWLAGFTLIEVLMVLVILVILGSIAVPVYHKVLDGANRNAAKVQVQLLEGAIDMYYISLRRYPSGLRDLIDPPSDQKTAKNWQGPYLKKNRILIDPWEDPYEYLAQGKQNRDSYDVWSLGPDRQDNTVDDIGNWDE